MWVRDSEALQVFLCRSSKSNGPTVNQPDRSTNAIFRQIIVYDAKKRNFVLETIYCKNYNHSHNSSLPQSRRFVTGPLLVYSKWGSYKHRKGPKVTEKNRKDTDKGHNDTEKDTCTYLIPEKRLYTRFPSKSFGAV